jgi:hypothetical protein
VPRRASPGSRRINHQDQSWDDARLADPVAAARARRHRARACIPDQLLRHTEKWWLALEMIGEMTGPS